MKFEKPVAVTKSGYGLEIYEGDEKIDAQLYKPVEDGRHIVTKDLPKKISLLIWKKEQFMNLHLIL